LTYTRARGAAGSEARGHAPPVERSEALDLKEEPHSAVVAAAACADLFRVGAGSPFCTSKPVAARAECLRVRWRSREIAAIGWQRGGCQRTPGLGVIGLPGQDRGRGRGGRPCAIGYDRGNHAPALARVVPLRPGNPRSWPLKRSPVTTRLESRSTPGARRERFCAIGRHIADRRSGCARRTLIAAHLGVSRRPDRWRR
jgi:hypothetical protein